jgi:hypothetical protein
MDDYVKVDFDGLKLKIQSISVPEGGFLLIALPRESDYLEVRDLLHTLNALGNVLAQVKPLSSPVLVWRDFNLKWMKRQELEDMKWRIEELLGHEQ